ncbi:hypothetical protein [Grimontia sp. SpTr1]|uniref:hypothetical protein n=1 Tax=Grimontia sp. SpTr1 TaxID=2995319 RepID=UPI00248AA4F3|nr:hypothetical protein [Grimontia sp. SpTr1]
MSVTTIQMRCPKDIRTQAKYINLQELKEELVQQVRDLPLFMGKDAALLEMHDIQTNIYRLYSKIEDISQ